MIAAGGSGSRDDGNKPERMLRDARPIDRDCNQAKRHSDVVALAVRPDDGAWGTGLPLLFDTMKGIGPISALHSAIYEAVRRVRAAPLLIGCDLPVLPYDLIHPLSAARLGQGVAMPVRHPMAAMWRSELGPLERWSAERGQSLLRYAEAIGMAQIEGADTPEPFAT